MKRQGELGPLRALVCAGLRVIRRWRGQALGLAELCRSGLGRDSEYQGLGGGQWGRTEKKAGFGRKSVSGSWKWETGVERVGKRLPKVNE